DPFWRWCRDDAYTRPVAISAAKICAFGRSGSGFGSARPVGAMTVVSMLTRVTFAAVAVAGIAGIATVHAQQPSGPPNALQGFSQNRDKPIKINSASLEVRDRDKMATFSGDVHLVQGDTTMHSKTLVVFYDDDPASKPAKPPAASATAAAPVNQQIRRVEARGD